MRALATDAPCVRCCAPVRVLIPLDEPLHCQACRPLTASLLERAVELCEHCQAGVEMDDDEHLLANGYVEPCLALLFRRGLTELTEWVVEPDLSDCPDWDTMAGEHAPPVGHRREPPCTP